MKFITEDDLRDLYKIEPFTDYIIEPGTRITPGARQFLADRGIIMSDEDSRCKKGKIKGQTACSQSDRKSKRMRCVLKSMEAQMLSAAQDLLGSDILLAQKVIALGRYFAGIRNILDSKESFEELSCQNCTGINEANFSDDMEDCFDITDFHVQLEKGREIILMHELRCALREIELDISEYFDGPDDGTKCEDVVKRVHRMINTLSQLICVAAGGEKCQKKA